jgi:hypothetical protein
MKTNQEMVRYIDNFTVVQRTSDGYFDGSELLRQWNGVEGNPRRRMSEFIDSTKVKEFLKALAEDESHRTKIDIGENQLLIKIKGRNTKEGKTPDKVWMNPLLFIKFAMWINPTFEVKVLRFVYDEMIRYRNDAGDAYKELSSAVMKIVPKDFMPKAMQKVGEALNWVIFNSHEKMLRNKYGDEMKQRELWQLEKKVSDLINEGFITNFDNLISYLRNQYQKRNNPQVFNYAS